MEKIKPFAFSETDSFDEVNKALNRLVDFCNKIIGNNDEYNADVDKFNKSIMKKPKKKKSKGKKGMASMKTLIAICMVAAMLFCSVAMGAVNLNEVNFTNVTSGTFDQQLRGWIDILNKDITNAAGLTNIGTGRVFYVDSNAGGSATSAGTSPASAWPTLDDAFDSGNGLEANRGDVVFVLQGSAESGVAAGLWDIDIAGVTVVHLGNGTNQGTYTFADTDTTVIANAADVKIYGGRLLAGISEVVVGLSYTGDADNLTVIGMVWPEPLTSSFEFNIGIQATTGADNVSFIGCTAYSADATGADHWFNGGAGVVNGLTLIGNVVIGEYAIAPIFSDQVDLENFIAWNDVTNLTSGQFGIEYSAAATGTLKYNTVFTDAEATSIDPGSMKCYENYVTTAINASGALFPLVDTQVGTTDAKLGGFSGDGGAAQDDSAKSSLDLINTDTALILANQAGTTTIAGQTYATLMTATSTGDDLFDVDGGAILIQAFTGLVTTNIGAVGNIITIELDADAGFADYDFSTAVETNADVAGSRYSFTDVALSVLTPMEGATGGGSILMGGGWFCGEGMIEQTSTGATTGAIQWYIIWTPYADGTTVTAQ